MNSDVARLLPARRGHFRLESGHHGDLWLDLELLCLHPEPVERLATQLAARLAGRDVEAVCGPPVEGAFVALTVARELAIPFAYAERFVADEKLALEAIASLPNEVWPPSDCPLCARGVPLEDLLES